MYGDPSLIRSYVVKLSLNEQENALLEAVANYRGQHRAALVRELVKEGLDRILAQHPEIAPKFG